MTRLIYLDSQPPIPHRQPSTPSWDVVTEVSHVLLCSNLKCYVKYIPYVGIYDSNPKQSVFDSE